MVEAWVAAAAVVGSAVVGGVASAYGANKQADAAENAQNIAENQYQNTVNLENPYNQAGYNATAELQNLEGIGMPNKAQSSAPGGYGSLNAPFTAQTFQSMSPAYQFQLQQGQQGVLNADASNEGALSGAAQKDLIGYSQSFANTSFNNAFNQYQTQNQNIYNRLANIANLGQSAASGTAQTGAALANTAASAATNVGNAYASGANGIANAANGLAQNSLMANYLNQNANYGDPYAYQQDVSQIPVSAGGTMPNQ